MKKLLTIAMMTAAVSALAVESSNTFGILRVDSSATETIVSIPWLAAGGGDIKVKDVVKTANLKTNDRLYYYDGTGYKLWVLNSNGVWEGAQSVDGDKVEAAAGDDATLARGGAIILVRNNPADCFYLYGQYTDTTSTTEVARHESFPTYVLIAPPTTSDTTTINSGTWTGLNAKDRIYLPTGSMLYWYNLGSDQVPNWKWCSLEFSESTGDDEYTEYTTAIPVGTGVWLKIAGGSGDVSVRW